ncbi:XisI protein [Candidatus Poribacteria bacterium]|nr:XisI protein [Candidatus Poribacteria bacterium]
MDRQRIEKQDYPDIIKRILTEYSQIKPANGEIEQEVVFDDSGKHYQLLLMGWMEYKRVFYASIHIDIKGNKVWVQQDRTEDGVTRELVAAGIPKDKIVLGFHSPDMRKYTEYAVE